MTPVPADGDLYLASEVPSSNVASARESLLSGCALACFSVPAHPTSGVFSLYVVFVCVGGSASGGLAPRLAGAHCRYIAAAVLVL